MQYTKPSLADYGLGRLAIGGLSTRRRARSVEQAATADLRDAQSIFAAEPALLGGIWLPDLAMMTQDSTGQTAAASGAVVGLVYDQSKGLALGPELVTNGSFDSESNWTLRSGAGTSISSGVINFSSSNGYWTQTIDYSIGQLYKVEIDVVRVSGTITIYLGSSQTSSYTITNSGHYSFLLVGAQTSLWLILDGAAFTGTVDNVSCKKLPGHSANQATTNNKPTLLNWQSTGKYSFFPPADNIALTATFPSSLGSVCTEFVTTTDGIEILENRTVGTTYNIADRYFFGRILLNRACTPHEKTLFTRMLTRYIPNTSLYKYDFAITQTGGGAADLKIITASATPVYIEWGDGTGGTVASNTTLSHTYAATYAGNVRVSSLSPITSWTSANGKWSFDVSRLPATLTAFYCFGDNSITGETNGFPPVISLINITGYNTIRGDVSKFPASATFILIAGANTVTGNISGISSAVTYISITGQNTINDYTSRSWANNQYRLTLTPVAPGGLSSSEVDQLLIDLAAAGGTWQSPKTILLTGANAARTSASNAAVATLQGKGVTVTTN